MVIDKDITIKGYELLERIGKGAYGAVYRAYQPHMRREVAIKIIYPRFANQPDFIRRFDLEAHLVAQLEHLHIVPLYDYWREPEGAYLVMRLMKGGSLENSLKDGGPWEPEQVVRLVDQIASALDAAHQQGVVHRDLKPANILLDEHGNGYLSDFGIAKELQMGKSITQTGAIVGTPAYMSPEQVQSLSVTPQTDIYALGVVIYELLVGGHPFLDTPTVKLVVKQINDPLPLVSKERADISQDVDRIIQRATEKDPASRYVSAGELAADFRRAMHLDLEEPDIPESEIYNPYKGLRPFQESDARDFFGRELLIQQLLLRLEEIGDHKRFLAVVGPSGSGKSSVVKAGLMPAIRAGNLPGSGDWFISQMKPGSYPLEELELAILRVAVSQPPSLLGQIKEDARGTLRAVRRVLPEGGQLLLVIDQLEELFTMVRDADETNFFLTSLFEAVSDPRSPLWVVATLRADYYDRPLMHPEFSTLIEKRTQVVKPLSTSELEQAICEPAKKMGVSFEEGLVSTIVGEIHEEPGGLPILQYALTELFDRRDGRLISRKSYEEIGGVRGALARRAEEIYLDLDDRNGEAARQLFLRLVTLGEGQEDTRRRVLRSEVNALLVEYSIGVIEVYGRARLLTFDHDQQTRQPTIEVAHEALLQEWGRLREWLDESRADIRLQRVLGNAAEEWNQSLRNSDFLLRGSRLNQFKAWAESSNLALTEIEMEFIEASLSQRRKREIIETERLAQEAALERRSRNFLRALVVVLAVAMVGAIVLSGITFNQRNLAEKNAATATYAQGLAINEAATAVAAQEEALDMGVALSLARVAADKASKLATTNELVAFANNELDNPSDVSYSLALLLAKQAVLTTLNSGESVTPGSEEVLRKAIDAAPHQTIALNGHTRSIRYASWSPDGLQTATASEDGTARIWDVQSGEELQVFTGHSGSVNHVSWGLDGNHILTSGVDRTVRMWEVESGEEVRTFRGHPNRVWDAKWINNGTQILSCSSEAIIVWNVYTNEEILRIPLIPSLELRATNFCQFNPSNNWIATNSGTEVVIYDSLSGEEVVRLGAGLDSHKALNWNSDGSKLLIIPDSNPNSVSIWDMRSFEIICEFHHDYSVDYASWNPSDDRISTVANGVVRIWDSDTGDLIDQWQANSSPLWSVEWSPDGDSIITAGGDGVARMWEVGAKDENKPIEHLSSVNTAILSPDGKYALSSSGSIAIIWDVKTKQKLLTFKRHNQPIFAAAWEPNGERIITGDAFGTAIIWNAVSGQVMVRIQCNGQAIISVDWSPGGKWVITGGRNGRAQIWDTENGDPKYSIFAHGSVQSVSWNPITDKIITTSADNKAFIWQADNGKQLIQLRGHTEGVSDADWSPAGDQVVTTSHDGTVRIWDAVTGQEIKQLIGHTGAVLSVEWEPGGKRILTGGEDGTARIWDARNGKEVGRISGHQGSIVEVHWYPDGSQILTASTDKTVRIWPVEIEGLLALADSLILRDPPEFTLAERCLYLHECGE